MTGVCFLPCTSVLPVLVCGAAVQCHCARLFMGIDTAESGGALPYLKVQECTCVSVSGEGEWTVLSAWLVDYFGEAFVAWCKVTNSLLGQVNLTAKSIIITPNLFIHTKSFSKRLRLSFRRAQLGKLLHIFQMGVLTQHPGLITSVYQNLIIPQKKHCFLRRLKKTNTHLSEQCI